MHRGVIYRVFATGGFPDQRGHVLTQAFERALGLLRRHPFADLVVVEMQRLATLGLEIKSESTGKEEAKAKAKA